MDDRARQVLDFAVAKERAAEAFYLRWAERSEDDDVKQLLGELAAEERSHSEKLSHITPEALIGEGTASAEFGLVKDLPSAPEDEQEMTVLDALSVAIRREEEAVTLYERMRGASTTEEALFAALAEEERRHKHRLELQYALLKSRIDRGRPGQV